MKNLHLHLTFSTGISKIVYKMIWVYKSKLQGNIAFTGAGTSLLFVKIFMGFINKKLSHIWKYIAIDNTSS